MRRKRNDMKNLGNEEGFTLIGPMTRAQAKKLCEEFANLKMNED